MVVISTQLGSTLRTRLRSKDLGYNSFLSLFIAMFRFGYGEPLSSCVFSPVSFILGVLPYLLGSRFI